MCFGDPNTSGQLRRTVIHTCVSYAIPYFEEGLIFTLQLCCFKTKCEHGLWASKWVCWPCFMLLSLHSLATCVSSVFGPLSSFSPTLQSSRLFRPSRSPSLPVLSHGCWGLSCLVHRPVELLSGALPAGGRQGRATGTSWKNPWNELKDFSLTL